MDENPKFTICVAGDPIYDEYQVGTLHKNRTPARLIVHETFGREGGAANVRANLVQVLKHSEIKVLALFEDDPSNWSGLNRLVDENEKILLEYQPGSRWNGACVIRLAGGSEYYQIPSSRKGLVLADYNKGGASNQLAPVYDDLLRTRGKFDFVVVDSRYGHYWPGWLDHAAMKILHATGDELSRHDTSLFNYTFHTNGPGDIHLLHWGQKVAVLQVPHVKDREVVDPTGAGDTFTACIAAYLATHCNQAWDTSLMIQAAQYAIPLCQETLQYLGVVVPQDEQ